MSDRRDLDVGDLLESPLEPREPRRFPWPLAIALIVVLAVAAIWLVADRGTPDESSTTTTTTSPEPEVQPGIPGERFFTRLAAAPSGDIFMLGGQTAFRTSPVGEAWRYSEGLWYPVATDEALAIAGPAVAYVDSLEGVLIHGGGTTPLGRCPAGWCTRDATDTTWLVSTDGEVEVIASEGPGARFGHAMVYHPENDLVVLFGGATGDGSDFLGDTWFFDPADGEWREVATESDAPIARAHHQMVLHPTTGHVILFGGLATNPQNADPIVWVFDTDEMKWSTLETTGDAPAGRWMHQMAVDPSSGQIAVVGGEFIETRTTGAGTTTERTCMGEIWVLDLDRARWSMHEGIDGAICAHAIAAAGDGAILAVRASEASLYDLDSRRWENLPALGDQ